MHVTYTPVTPVKFEAICDCGGRLRPTGRSKLVSPPMYEHKCDKCGASGDLKQEMPAIEYMTEEQLKEL